MNSIQLPVFEKKIRQEAMVNEIKGGLFEHLVAQQLAALFELQQVYYLDLMNQKEGDVFQRLANYQQWLMKNDRDLFFKLKKLAELTAPKIHEELLFVPQKIIPIGTKEKMGPFAQWREADLLFLAEGQAQGLSLKLCKDHSYVNTKSGGIQSFVQKYFGHFPLGKQRQRELDELIEREFFYLGHKLYEEYGLGAFEGKFDERWKDNYPELPGELEESARDVLQNFYHLIISKLYQIMKEFYDDDKKAFIQGLWPIVGLENKDVFQAICFHGGNYKDRYSPKGVDIHSRAWMAAHLEILQLQELRPSLSSFEFHMGPLRMQIRIKPMNVFTVPSYKVNCSIKFQSAIAEQF